MGVHSGVGVLRAVIACRPGLALERSSPDRLPCRPGGTPVWLPQAQRDHDEFVATLQSRGIEVLELRTLLAKVLENARARRWLIDRLLEPTLADPGLFDELHAALLGLSGAALADRMIDGMTREELPMRPSGLLSAVLDMHEYVMPPLGGSTQPRSVSAWVYNGALVGQPARRDRRAEALIMRAIYDFHPDFAGPDSVLCPCRDGSTSVEPATLHGSDVAALGHGVVLVAVGQHTHPYAVIPTARALFERGEAKVMVVAQLPASAHGADLSSVFNPCAPDLVSYEPAVADRVVCHEWRPSKGAQGMEARTRSGMHVLDVLSEVLGCRPFRTIGPVGDVLPLSPGVVMAFDRNAAANHMLRAAGVDVVETTGGELGRLSAGPASLACVVSRDPVRWH